MSNPVTSQKFGQAFGPEADQIEEHEAKDRKDLSPANSFADLSPSFRRINPNRVTKLPTSPSSSTGEKRKIHFSIPYEESPETTPVKRKKVPQPNTPGKKPFNQDLFEGFAFPSTDPRGHRDNKMLETLQIQYKSKEYTPEGSMEPHIILKQNILNDCGGASAAMLLSDVILKDAKLVKCDDRSCENFQNWCALRTLTKPEDLKKGLKLALNDTVKVQTGNLPLDAAQAFKQIHALHRESELPIIVSIEHPIIRGHWILIDKVTDTHAFIRDPASGKAYKITREKLGPCLIESTSGEDFIALHIKNQ